MSGSLRGLARRWFRKSVGSIVDFTMERLDEIDAELEEDEELEDLEDVLDEDWLEPELIRPGHFPATSSDPVSSDGDLQPDPAWIEVPMVDAEANEVISLHGGLDEDGNPGGLLRVVPRELPAGSLKFMGVRVTISREGTVVGLTQNLRVGASPNLFVHSGWAQLDAFTSLRELRAYPRFVADDEVTMDLAAWGEGTVVCTVSIYLDVIYLDVLPPTSLDDD